MVKAALLKMLTLKAGTVAVLAVGAGGVALAATTGVLPNPLNGPASNPGQEDQAPGPSNGRGDPSPSWVGLCRAFRAGAGADHGKALENPAFTALITAAGGKDNVDAFCTETLGTPPPSPHPTGESTGQSAEHPGSQASTPAHPTGAPASHPGS